MTHYYSKWHCLLVQLIAILSDRKMQHYVDGFNSRITYAFIYFRHLVTKWNITRTSYCNFGIENINRKKILYIVIRPQEPGPAVNLHLVKALCDRELPESQLESAANNVNFYLCAIYSHLINIKYVRNICCKHSPEVVLILSPALALFSSVQT